MYGLRFRRSQLHVIAGRPSSGKSLFAQLTAHKIGASTLYVSADGDQATMLDREAAIATSDTLAVVEAAREQGEFQARYAAALAGSPIVYYFEPAPSLKNVWHELLAYLEIYGQYPDVVIIDNLMNLAEGEGDEWSALRSVMKELHYLARKVKSSFWVLHHTTESVGSPLAPPPMSAVQGKINQLPEVILTVANDRQSAFGVAVVKNRNGRSDPGADHPVWLVMDGSRMVIREQTYGDQLRERGVLS